LGIQPPKNAVASLFLFDEFSYPSQKTTEKGKKREKKVNAPYTKAFLEEINGKKSPHYEEMFSEIIIFRLHRSKKEKKKKKRGVVFNHIAKILKKNNS
jgi:hypothetical protein